MKYALTFLFIVAMLSSGYAQSSNKKALPPNKVVTFDFSKPIYPGTEDIKPKQKVEIVLKNVNPYVYEVNFSDSLIQYPKQQPDQFGGIFSMPALSTLPKAVPLSSDSVAGKLPKPGSGSKKSVGVIKESDEALSKLLVDYSSAELLVKDVLKYSQVPNELNKLLFDCSLTLEEAKHLASTYIETAISGVAAETVPLGIVSVIDGSVTSSQSAIERLITDADALKKKYSSSVDESDKTISLAEYKELVKNVNSKLAIIDKLIANATALKEKLAAFGDAKVGEAIVESYNKIATSRIEVHHIVSSGYSSDEVLSTVLIKKKKEVFCSQEITTFPVNEIVRGGVKIDFSTGLVFNIGQNRFFDQKYSYDSVYRAGGNVLADSVAVVRNKNRNIVTPSLGVFMHVYTRCLSHVSLGGMLGASMGTDQKLYYHVGGSILIGKADRFVVSGGLSFAKATVLDGAYEEGQILKRSLAPTAVPTESVTRVGGFVSLSYNLNLIK